MVKSTSCFKIITCGSDSTDKDDLAVPERKGSNDKRGWSFRKKSAQQRVLSNTVTLETPSGNKESPESASFSYPPPANSNVQEKFSAMQSLDEKPQLSTSPKPKVMETIVVCENDSKLDLNTEESVVIVIQAAIRGFLGQKMLLKIKNVIKLQAVVRGHLVRCHAVGTLRCVQAIVKMQALVRARRARISVEGSCPEKKLDENHREENKSKTREKESPVNKSTITHISIEKLLSNGFARQLLESTPKTKAIHVKCDPSKPDSAWKWLERWMSVSSPSTAEVDKASSPSPAESDKVELVTGQEERGKDENFVSPVETKSTAELDKASSPSQAESDKVELITGQEEREKDKNFVSPVETKSPSEVFPESQNVNSSNRESEGPPESEDNLIALNPGSFSFQACHPISSPLKDELEQCFPDANQTLLEVISPSNQSTPADSNSHVEFNAPSMKPETETETEEPKRSMKRLASEELETEGKKYVFGSRKVSNPAFVAAQSKFEELSTTANSGGSISSSNQDAGIESLSASSSLHIPGVESISDTIFSGAETVMNTKEPTMVETSAPDSSRTQVGGSECGTELSITSTLDSPDRPEDGAAECEHEAKVFEDGICNPNSMENDKLESKDVSTISSSNLSPFVLDEAEKCGDINGESVTLMVAMDSPETEHKVENNAADMQRQLDSETGHQPNRSSPEASPRSHITIPESHGTPSSQVSVNGKKKRTEKSGSDHKRRSLSGGKKSPSIPNHDSGSRSSMEQLPKDQRNGKRRNSFGSPRPDHTEQEPRDSGSNNSIPRFMQATESARAKAQANSSPRSSPDVQDGDIYVKKRHSLPGANGRQGSPRIERSMSQAQQSAKGNGTYHHERKWQR